MREDEAFRSVFDLIRQFYIYWRSLNLRSEALFMTTSTCWAMPNKSVVVLVLVFAGAIFVKKVINDLPVKRTFWAQAEELASAITSSSELSDDRKSYYLSELNFTTSEILTFRHAIPYVGWFLFSIGFYVFTFYWCLIGRMPLC
ncbi:MAG: hypothetical protein P8171_07600 [Candidatus Thiodiazotropha sp.]